MRGNLIINFHMKSDNKSISFIRWNVKAFNTTFFWIRVVPRSSSVFISNFDFVYSFQTNETEEKLISPVIEFFSSLAHFLKMPSKKMMEKIIHGGQFLKESGVEKDTNRKRNPLGLLNVYLSNLESILVSMSSHLSIMYTKQAKNRLPTDDTFDNVFILFSHTHIPWHTQLPHYIPLRLGNAKDLRFQSPLAQSQLHHVLIR